ncbi:MAG TPA: NADH-quinone oxidoreductase subunit C [Polyangiaceae bacterium]|jgi:NADH-quinone oxidoreductase subunit C
MSKRLVELIQSRFPRAVLAAHSQFGDDTAVIDPANWKEVARFLRDSAETDMNMLSDLTAVDFPDREPRFDIVAHLYSLSKGHRLRLKTQVGDGEGNGAEVETLSDLWASANWAERECFDMFGVTFRGHPDLRRILMYPEFEGYPLRRDYDAGHIQPLVPYREISGIEKLPPFGTDEGMSFGRQSHAGLSEDEAATSNDETRVR